MLLVTLLGVYKFLLSLNTIKLLNYQRQWQSDCKTLITGGEWHKIWLSPTAKSKILPIRIQNIKLLTTWHLPPYRLKWIKPSTENLCWKGCRSRADYFHCWWSCPFIQTYWKHKENKQSHPMIVPFKTGSTFAES